MTTLSSSSYGVQLKMGDGVPLAPLSITAATNATPIVVTTATHGIADVSYVTVSGVLGNLGANGTFVAERVSATQLKLRGSVGTGAYTSGGTLVRTETFATIAEIRNIQDAGIQTEMVEVSAHDGGEWASSIPILLRGRSLRLDLNFVPLDPTHGQDTGLIFLGIGRFRRSWLLVFPTAVKAVAWWQGYVADWTEQLPVNNAMQASAVVTVDREMTWSTS
jgi:hypothetical protein